MLKNLIMAELVRQSYEVSQNRVTRLALSTTFVGLQLAGAYKLASNAGVNAFVVASDARDLLAGLRPSKGEQDETVTKKAAA